MKGNLYQNLEYDQRVALFHPNPVLRFILRKLIMPGLLICMYVNYYDTKRKESFSSKPAFIGKWPEEWKANFIKDHVGRQVKK